MSEDRFDDEKPNIVFSSQTVSLTAYIGEENEGYFSFRSTNDVTIRGIVYSSNPYVVCKNPQFESTEATIRFTPIISEPKNNDTLSGDFTIIANRFEKSIPFSIRFVKRPISSRDGDITDLKSFTSFYRNHENLAIQLFYEDRFKSVIKEEGIKTALLYRGFENALRIPKNVESFLVYAGQKERTAFSMKEERRTYFSLTENQKDYIELTRDTWGEIDIRTKVNGDFISLEKERITKDYFLGNSLRLNYYVHANKLHHGLNTATVEFFDGTTRKKLEILASPDDEGDLSYISDLHKKKLIYELTSVYRSFRLGNTKSQTFSEESIRIIDELQKYSDDGYLAGNGIEVPPKNMWYQLMKVQALIVGRKEEEANWLIGDLKTDITDKRSAEWAYLLYLCTLLEPEEEYINKLTEEIEGIFREHPDDVRIFWFLLYLREEYMDDPVRKLKAVSMWIMQGERSPYMMIEAYYIISREPYLLTEFSEFTKRVLKWTVRKNALTKDICLQIAHVLENEKDFDEDLYEILKAAYKAFPEEELFMQILSYLLRSVKYGEEFLFWYEEAVKKEVRLTGLYEAYIMSVRGDDERQLPELVTLYFRYQNNLSYQKMAYLYANIIKHRRTSPGIYEKYLRSIETFAMEQMRLGRIDDDLAVIYQIILDIGLINADVSDAMSMLLFTKKIRVPSEDIIKVHVYEAYRKDHLTVPVEGNYAFAPILTDEYRIFFENEEGMIIPSDEKTFVKTLFRYNAFYDQLKEEANKKLPYIIHDFGTGESRRRLFEREDLQFVEDFLNAPSVSREYLADLYPEMKEFLTEVGREDMLEKHLLYTEPFEYIDGSLITYIIECAIKNGLYDKAYELIQRFNGTDADERQLRKLYSYMTADEELESDDFLILSCADLMEKNCFSENMINYLNRYYVGPTVLMKRLCDLTDDYRLKGEGLYERTLLQMLYTEHIDENSGKIYLNYLDHNPNKMVIEAYLTYMGRRYILEEGEVPEIVFSELLRFYLRDTNLNDTCKVALAKRLCLEKEISDKEFKALDSLINDFTLKNIYFGFYSDMPRSISVKYHYYDKTFIEYKCEPQKKLLIRFRENDNTREADLLEMYEGIYVSSVVLYFGDTVNYDIIEEEGQNVLFSDRMSGKEIVDEREESRFSRINRMQSMIIYGEDEKLTEAVHDYIVTENIVERMFTTV